MVGHRDRLQLMIHTLASNCVVVGFMPPLDALEVRQIRPRYSSQDERIEISDHRRAGLSIRAIADRLSRAPSAISRELRRNAAADSEYQHPDNEADSLRCA